MKHEITEARTSSVIKVEEGVVIRITVQKVERVEYDGIVDLVPYERKIATVIGPASISINYED